MNTWTTDDLTRQAPQGRHTPTTADVREQYTREEPPRIGTVSEKADEFDRWLGQVKAEARREGQVEAWDEGYRAGSEDMSDLRAGRLTFQTITSNHYREPGDRHVDQ